MKKLLTFMTLFLLITLVSPLSASSQRQVATLDTAGTQRTLHLPWQADNSPVISLGTAVDPASGQVVEGYAFVHPKNSPAKPPWAGGNSGATKCYGFLAKGAKWKTIEPWLVNSSNSRGLGGSFVLNDLGDDIAKWEDAADGSVGDGGSINILGNGSLTSATLIADTISPDNNNEVYFADISSSSAIAVTIIWGIFGGPIAGRVLVEWDQIYDDIDFDWSSNGESDKMDFGNIATHELGHSVGLDDLYDANCSKETMYGYASDGETKKQTLESGDIAGISSLY